MLVCPSQWLIVTSASHFLQAGVDIVTIGRWLRHASVSTTSIYAEVDLQSKREAVRKAEPLLNADPNSGNWRTNADLLHILRGQRLGNDLSYPAILRVPGLVRQDPWGPGRARGTSYDRGR